jgi:hypothetical protein
VLVAVTGEDPAEAAVLGVFDSQEKARGVQDHIDARTASYWRSVVEAGNALAGRWREWFAQVGKAVVGRCWPHGWLEKYQSFARMIDGGGLFCRLVQHASARADFLRAAREVLAAVPDPGGPPMPEVPPPLPPPDGPQFYHYQMSIHEQEMQ